MVYSGKNIQKNHRKERKPFKRHATTLNIKIRIKICNYYKFTGIPSESETGSTLKLEQVRLGVKYCTWYVADNDSLPALAYFQSSDLLKVFPLFRNLTQVR